MTLDKENRWNSAACEPQKLHERVVVGWVRAEHISGPWEVSALNLFCAQCGAAIFSLVFVEDSFLEMPHSPLQTSILLYTWETQHDYDIVCVSQIPCELERWLKW